MAKKSQDKKLEMSIEDRIKKLRQGVIIKQISDNTSIVDSEKVNASDVADILQMMLDRIDDLGFSIGGKADRMPYGQHDYGP